MSKVKWGTKEQSSEDCCSSLPRALLQLKPCFAAAQSFINSCSDSKVGRMVHGQWGGLGCCANPPAGSAFPRRVRFWGARLLLLPEHASQGGLGGTAEQRSKAPAPVKSVALNA